MQIVLFLKIRLREDGRVFGFANKKSVLEGKGFVIQNFMPMLVLTGKDGFVTNNHSLHKW